MRDLSSAIQTNIAKPVTQPVYLLEINFPSSPVRASSGAIITWDSRTFYYQGLQVLFVTDAELRFVLEDDQDAVKALIDFEGIDDVPVTLWSYYETEAKLRWTGFTDGVRYQNHQAEFNAARTRAQASTFPPYLFNRTTFPRLPVEGKIIRYGNLELELKVR